MDDDRTVFIVMEEVYGSGQRSMLLKYATPFGVYTTEAKAQAERDRLNSEFHPTERMYCIIETEVLN